MNWQCKLYGHQWRHPGAYEVVVADGVAPAYPVQCTTCGSERLVTRDAARAWDEWSTSTERELRSEVESPSENDVTDESPEA